MVDRIQLTKPTFMKFDGQWQVIYPGTVLDVPDSAAFKGSSTLLSPAESSGTLASHGGPTPVRNLRRMF